MATKNIVPRATNEGNIGRADKKWIGGYFNNLIDLGKINFTDPTTLTIASGVVTITQSYNYIDTESSTASDDLNTISGGATGDSLYICALNTARTIVLKHGTGNILTSDGLDISLDSTEKIVQLIYNGANWIVAGSAAGGAPGSSGYSGYSGLGLSGYSGYSGISGYSGYSGQSGYSGYSGSGVSGYSGYSGSGVSGYSGYSGISGYSGYSGISGYSGYSGISGYSGYSGISGYSGYSGLSGYSGYSGSGVSGYSGYSGYSGVGDTIVVKSGDTSRLNNGLIDATGLSFSASANTSYIIDCYIRYETTSVNSGIRLSASFSGASPTEIAGQWFVNAVNGTPDGGAFNANDVTVAASASPFLTGNIANLWCLLMVGANAGTFIIRFACENNETITIKSGSVLKYRSV